MPGDAVPWPGAWGCPLPSFFFRSAACSSRRGGAGGLRLQAGVRGVLCPLSFFGPPPAASEEEVLGDCVPKPGERRYPLPSSFLSARRLRRVKRRCWGTASPSRGNGDIPCPLPFFRPAACGTRRGGAGGRSPMAGGAGGSPVFFSPLRGAPPAGRGSTR